MRLRTKAKLSFEPSFKRRPVPQDARGKVGRRQGALVRTIARRSIRRRKKASQPGTPPTNREGQLKRFLFFSWDPTTQSVVIGPEQLGGSDTPAVLEGTRRRGRQRGLKPRPFMVPALEKAKAKLPELWRGAIK